MAVQRSRSNPRALHCSFCHKRQNVAGKLISSARGHQPQVHICDACVIACRDISTDESPAPSKTTKQNLRCSFCFKPEREVQGIITPSRDSRISICDECLAVCCSILEDDSEEKTADDSQGWAFRQPSFLKHPLHPQFLLLAELWILSESRGQDATRELSEMRTLGQRMLAEALPAPNPLSR